RYQSTAELADELLSALGGTVGRATFDNFERARADGTGAMRVERATGRPRRLAPWIAIASAVFAAAALGALLVFGGEGEIPVEQSAAAIVAEPEPLPQVEETHDVQEDQLAREPDPSDEPPAPDPQVSVHVETVPSGAQATIEGSDVMCAPTPCELVAAHGEPINIAAVRGRAAGSVAITPEGRTTVQILLA